MIMKREYILVTGASSGMGAQIAKDLSKDYNIILNGRDEGRLEAVRKECFEGEHVIWKYDLSNVDGVFDSLVENLPGYKGEITKFVHCAGYMKMYPVRVFSPEIFQSAFNVNVISAAMIVKYLTGRNTNGSALNNVVFISSNISNFGAKAFSVYSSSKAAVDGLMRSLAVELAPKVRVNSVLPGGVHTRMTDAMYKNEELISRMTATYPLGLGTVNNISDAVCFLLSDKAGWITGQQITVDGGRTVNITG